MKKLVLDATYHSRPIRVYSDVSMTLRAHGAGGGTYGFLVLEIDDDKNTNSKQKRLL